MPIRAKDSRRKPVPGDRNWLAEPRTGVLAVLGLVVAIGGGRRLLRGSAARKMIARLNQPDVTPEVVEDAARFDRAALPDLFRLQSEAPSAPVRDAAARALAVLWSEDQLIPEEEQALTRRGFQVEWTARRRYPRHLTCEIPIRVRYGLPFLSPQGPGLIPDHLAWSHRISGARRAAIEEESTPTPGAGSAVFTIVPADFESDGPHRLVLQARVHTVGLTDSWRIDLPHIPFNFEFDPRLDVESLLASPDAALADVMHAAVRLDRAETAESVTPRFFPVGSDLMIRNPPRLVVSHPLPRDLAHRVWLEVDGADGRLAGGTLLVHGRSIRDDERTLERSTLHELAAPLDLNASAPALDRTGRRSIRVVLTADPNLGWTDPEIRSVWPGEITTDWTEVEIVRR